MTEQEVIIESSIKGVTVFNDRAQILRQAQLSLTAGQQLLIFDDLPENIDQRSIQVNGRGKAKISNVQFRKRLKQSTSEQAQAALEEKKKSLEEAIKQAKDELKRHQAHEKFIYQLSDKLTQSDTSELDLNPENWRKILNFQQEELQKSAQNIREAQNLLTKLEAQLEEYTFGLQADTASAKIRYQVQVMVELKEDSEIDLVLSYIVPNAGWYPVYDFRVDTDKREVQIVYNARVWQKTNENWQDVSLRLSTARPQISGKHPELTPWRLNLKSETVLPPAAKASNMMKKERSRSARKEMEEALVGGLGSAMTGSVFEVASSSEIEAKSSQVETGSTSVVFNAAGEHNVRNDGETQQVNILQETFSGYFRYSTIPKLSPFAYLKAKVTNQTDYPFLAGESNVFMDGNFVASSQIETTAPNEEFWIFLGIDEGIKVEHKFLKKREQKEGGIFSKKSRLLLYEYEITLKNNKKTEEEIVVWDQLPISGNKEIKVSLIEPPYKEDSDTLKKNEYEYLEWLFQLSPGAEQRIPFKFSVEYPEDQTLAL